MKLLLVVALLALATYLTVRLMQSRGLPGGGRPVSRPRPRPRPVAPDDDDEFLRDLERRRRRPEDPESST